MTRKSYKELLQVTISLVETNICPVCRTNGVSKLLFELEKTKVYRCLCGLKFIDPSLDAESMMRIYQSSESLKEINPALENYYEYDTLNPQSLTCKDYTRALERAARHVQRRDLLEIGCGTGSFLDFARSKGWNPYGVDSSSENIAKLQQKGIEGACANSLDYFPDLCFDLIALWDLIEHLQDPFSFVKKSWQMLNPNGLLLIATPHDPNLLTLLANFFYRLSAGKIRFPVKQLYFLEHTSYFSLKTLSVLLKKGQFEIIQSWKTETDLERYRFSKLTRTALQISFFLARFLKLQNRIFVIAKKQS